MIQINADTSKIKAISTNLRLDQLVNKLNNL